MPEVEICNICKCKVKDGQDGLLCDKCLVWKHRGCLSMPQKTYDRISKSNQPWHCEPCEKTKDKNLVKTKAYTIDDVMAKLQDMEHKYNALFGKFEEQLEMNQKLQNELLEIKKKLNKKEQAEINNNIIIQGIPEMQNENLTNIVNKLGEKLEVSLEGKYTACRLGRNDDQRCRAIRVVFQNQADKSNLLKSKNRLQLGSRQLGYNNNNKVYLNHDLTKINLDIFKAAKIYKNEHNYKYIWIKNGNILLRKDETSRVCLIEDIDQLKN